MIYLSRGYANNLEPVLIIADFNNDPIKNHIPNKVAI